MSPTSRRELTQGLRLVTAGIYVAYLLGLGQYLNDQIPPPFGLAGLWFYAASAAIVLGEFIIEPFFTRPADALANGLAVVIATVSVSLNEATTSARQSEVGRALLLGLAGFVIASAILAILFKDASGSRQRLAVECARLSGVLGRSRVLYSVLLFVAGYASFSDSGTKIAVLYLSWFVILIVQPVEPVVSWIATRTAAPDRGATGVVKAIEDPGTALVEFPRDTLLTLGQRARLSNAIGTVVDHTLIAAQPVARIAVDSTTRVGVGSRVALEDQPVDATYLGQVAPGTNLDELVVETIATVGETGISEGRLVSARISAADVLYQVVGAKIERRQDTALSREIIAVNARKLGVWRTEETVFDPVPWLPVAGQAVVLLNHATAPFRPDEVGQVPGTTYGIKLDVSLAVTHNTAILGILGIGKTHLAWELISRMLCEGIKVLALDITGQYNSRFADLFPPAEEERLGAAIDALIAPNLTNTQVRDGEAGNFRDFDRALRDVLERFLASDSRLVVINPARFDVSRMDGRPFQGHANHLSNLSMVDVTYLIAEHLLRLVQDTPTDRARVCLVLEEAHSLVPEWNSTTNDSERYAANGTARAVLQGRKYGLGCLLITQRTANVTKSILNQCNTVFAMRIYDATGMGFLQNYIGPTHAGLLATLSDRTAIVFGRASSCNAPLVIRLNDSDDFNRGYWENCDGMIPVTAGLIEDEEADVEADAEDPLEDDDIPF